MTQKVNRCKSSQKHDILMSWVHIGELAACTSVTVIVSRTKVLAAVPELVDTTLSISSIAQ